MSRPEKLHFKTSSGIKNIVGKDLITDRFVAIFELVKNAYDARASEVVVSFDSLGETPSITIRDNGIGMSREDIEKKWLHLAYSEKKEGHANEERAFVGSKGIGRFSCDSLGSWLQIRTKKANESKENQLNVNWQDFDESLDRRFETIDVEYTSIDVSDEKLPESYTSLLIKNLHHTWDNGAINKVSESLRRLKNPFVEDDGFNIYCGGEIFSLFADNKGIPKEFLLKSNIAEVIKGKSVTIETTIDKKIKIELFDRGSHIYTVQKDNDTPLKNAEIFISINYLTTSAKATFTRRMGVAPRRYGNIFVYRNNFRVSPYGDEHADLFALNIRKTQGYSRFIGTREIIGHIDIKDTKDMFRETSSRNNGFIENIYYESLKDVYMEFAHKPLEKYVNLIQWGEDSTTAEEISLNTLGRNEAERFKNSLSSNNPEGFKLEYFADNLSFEDNNPKKQLEKIAANLPHKQQTVIEKAIDKIEILEIENQEKSSALATKQQTISSLEVQKQNLLNRRPDSSYHEQLTHHFPKLITRLNSSISDLNVLAQQLPEDKRNNIYNTIRKIRRTSLELASIKYLLLKTNFDFRAATKINWVEYVTEFSKEKSPKSNDGKIKVVCIFENENVKSDWNVICNPLELNMMLENFYANAQEHSSTFLQFDFKHDSIDVTSDSTPIAEDNLERVFELGFSTKANGTGVGLNQVKTFLKDKCNLKIKVQNQFNVVCFQIHK